jgi:uncharacterized protein
MLKAQAQVETPKAERYLKALCNHFSHKVRASYEDTRGSVDFGIGNCEMYAQEGRLDFHIQAADQENLERVKYVVADHLERFSGDEKLQVAWVALTE